eukprot:12908464-Prorocentrum_lima.AAC.1
MLDDTLYVKWVASGQQLANALTRVSPDAFVYLRRVLDTTVFDLMHDERSEERLRECRDDTKAQRARTH